MKRGTSATTRAMQGAPHRAIYIWCNEVLDYPARLAKELGRSDLRIMRRSQLRTLQGVHAHVVIDHACTELSHEEYSVAYLLNNAAKIA